MAEHKKWLLLTSAPDQLTAEIWKDILVNEGIPAIVSPEDTASFMGISAFPCRILVARGYRKKALEILDSLETEVGESGELGEGDG